MMDFRQFETRKRDHLRHALDPAHQAAGQSGLERVHLVHEALPELSFDEITLDSTRLGTSASKPFYISGMTAGHTGAVEINAQLAEACQEKQWALGVGSQRRELEGEAGAAGGVDHWRAFRKKFPKLVLFSNIGLSQAVHASIDRIRALVETLEAQALVIHLNALQESLQPEGTPQFRGGLERLTKLSREAGCPIIVKETGCGFSRSTLARLKDTGIRAVDLSGKGGTHWGRIEGARAATPFKAQREASHVFQNWGESTLDCLLAAHDVLKGHIEYWASGGVRTGLDAARGLALGAAQVGYAQPALQALTDGASQDPIASLRQWMTQQEYELRVALFCTGSRSPLELQRKEDAWKINT